MVEHDDMWVRDAILAGGFGVWWWIVGDGDVASRSGRVERLGLPGQIVRLEEFLQQIHPDDQEMVAGALQRAIETREPYAATFRLGSAERYRWMEARGHVVCDEQGRVVEMRGSSQDVTARIHDEQAVVRIADGVMGRQGEGFLLSLVENLVSVLEGDIAFVGAYDPRSSSVQTVSTWVDGRPGENFAYTLEGTPCENVIDREYCLYPMDVQALFPTDIMLVDMGIEAYAGLPLFDEQEEPVGLVVVLWRRPVPNVGLAQSVLRIFGARAGAELARLAVEAKRRRSLAMLERHGMALAALSRSEVWQSASLQATSHTLTRIAVSTLDVDRASIWFFNHDRQMLVLADLYEASSGEHSTDQRLSRLSYDAYFASLEADRTIAAHDALVDPRTRALARGYLLPQGVGALLSSPVRSRGQVVGVLTCEHRAVRDWLPEEQSFAASLADFAALALVLSERHQLEEHLRQAQKMESIGRLAGGIAHDFNNLLTAISGTTELARMMLPGDHAVQALLEETLDASTRAANLTSQLLAFARRRVVEPQVIVLNGVVLRIRNVLQRLLGPDSVLVTELEPSLWAVRLDPGPFEQILVNLTVNSRDAMPAGGTLTIRTHNQVLEERLASLTPGRYAVLEVEDTGRGIAPDDLEHIFEPFFTTKLRASGTGLGLATCYGIVAQVGGHIGVESEPGQGTRFTLYFPQIEGEAGEVTLSSEQELGLEGRETILLVEDDPSVRVMAARGLQAHGYTVIATTSAAEALRVLERESAVDLVVSDIVMPGMSGVELVERIKDAAPTLPVLLVSGSLEHWRDGEVGFLPKPYTPAVLARRVRLLLDGGSS